MPPDWFRRTRHQDRGRLWKPTVRDSPDLSGVWGCLRSHHRVWESALNDDVQGLLVFEDDAVFCKQFNVRLLDFLGAVPDDWDQVYLGGQHLGVDGLWPQPVNAQVLRGRYVNRTHAYMIRRPMLDELYRHFQEPWASENSQMFHLDHQLCQLHRKFNKIERRYEWDIYCPRQWLVGQAEDVSDVKMGKPQREHWWEQFEICDDVKDSAPLTTALA